jgi:hypothetical protein
MCMRIVIFLSVVMLAAPSFSEAQQIGGWVSANATAAMPAAATFSEVSIFPFRSEQFQTTHGYTEKQKPSFDIGGGLLFGQLGVGLAVTRYADPEKATSNISVPSFFFFNDAATASATTHDLLKHEQTAVHIEARYVANRPHASVAIFAGPSYIKTRQELVTDVIYSEFISRTTLAHSVSITGYDSESFNLHAWGYNVGVDGGYYFTNNVGIGGVLRFSRATVQLPNAIQNANSGGNATQDLNVGGFNAGGGVRFRF